MRKQITGSGEIRKGDEYICSVDYEIVITQKRGGRKSLSGRFRVSPREARKTPVPQTLNEGTQELFLSLEQPVLEWQEQMPILVNPLDTLKGQYRFVSRAV